MPRGPIERNILRLILSSREALSQSDLSRRLNVSSATVCMIVRKLKALDLITEDKRFVRKTHGAGRPSVSLIVNEKAPIIISIRARSQKIRVATCTLRGEILHQNTIDCRGCDSASDMLALIKTCVRRTHAQVRRQKSNPEVLGVGIAMAGVVNPRTGLINDTGMNGHTLFQIREKLQEELKLPVAVSNAVVADCLAERYFGAAREQQDFVYLQVLPFLRAVIFIHDMLYQGARGFAGEVGTVPIHRADNDVLYEADLIDHDVFGLPLLRNRRYVHSEVYDESLRFRQSISDSSTVEHKLKSVSQDLPQLHAMLRTIGRVTGRLLTTLNAYLNPSMVVIGGLEASWWPVFLTEAKQYMGQWFEYHGEGPSMSIEPAMFSETREAVASACILLEDLVGPTTFEFKSADKTPAP